MQVMHQCHLYSHLIAGSVAQEVLTFLLFEQHAYDV